MTEVVFDEQKVMEDRYVLPYNWIRKSYSRGWRQKNGLWAIASKLSGPLEGKVVLDVGCGDGWYTAKMVTHAAKTIGVDYSDKAIDFARIILPKAEFHAASMVEMPVPQKSVDIAFCFQVIEHIPLPDLPAAIGGLARVLKDDGVLIISVPSTLRKRSTAHFQHFTPESLAETLSPHFEIIEMVGQEDRTWVLPLIEKFIENRLWIVPPIGKRFGKGMFLRYWNTTSAEKGQNIMALCRKRAN